MSDDEHAGVRSHVMEISADEVGFVTDVIIDGTRFVPHFGPDLLPEIIAAAGAAENTLRSMSQIVCVIIKDDDATIMLQKADRLRDAIAAFEE